MRTQTSAEAQKFGRCRHCERPPDDFLFTEHIYWALCTPCQTAWWAMFSARGWRLSEVQVRQAEAELAGWDIGDEEKDAYVTGAIAQIDFVKDMRWPSLKHTLLLDLRSSDGARIHVRTARFKGAPLLFHAGDPGDDILAFPIAIPA